MEDPNAAGVEVLSAKLAEAVAPPPLLVTPTERARCLGVLRGYAREAGGGAVARQWARDAEACAFAAAVARGTAPERPVLTGDGNAHVTRTYHEGICAAGGMLLQWDWATVAAVPALQALTAAPASVAARLQSSGVGQEKSAQLTVLRHCMREADETGRATRVGKDGLLICRACGGADVMPIFAQLKSGDESTSMGCKCNTCGAKWSVKEM